MTPEIIVSQRIYVTLLAGFKGPTSKEREGREGKRRDGEGREGRKRREGERER